jgi:hypothetical protein
VLVRPTSAAPQQGDTLYVWVDPVNGADPTGNPDAWINDPDYMFRTLQKAIDVVHERLRTDWVLDKNQQAIVWALPGFYGPWGGNTSGDVFPIRMRDRVHVQGVGARRCVIRGAGPATHPGLFWPDHSSASALTSGYDATVLLTWESAHPTSLGPSGGPYAAAPAPWLVGTCGGDTAEVLDGFTFQSGDVQVLVWDPPGTPQYSPPATGRSGRISNCVFDLRNDFQVPDPNDPTVSSAVPITLFGPHFCIMLLKRYVQPLAGSPGGYYDQPFLIAHNTFIFGKWGVNEPSDPVGGGGTWYFKARRPSAAIIDVTDPGCSPGPTDSDNNLRGVGRAGILGNLFRTIGDSYHHPMLGIEDVDTVLAVGGPGGAPVQTNAFDSLLAARTFAAGAFYSTPVAATAQYSGSCGNLWNDNSNPPTVGCPPPSQAATPSTFPANPPVEIWHGPAASPNLGADPAFVGEYLEVTYGGAMVYHSDDWRLLPGSPCEDKGYPLTSGTPLPRLVYTLAGEVFDSAHCRSSRSSTSGTASTGAIRVGSTASTRRRRATAPTSGSTRRT